MAPAIVGLWKPVQEEHWSTAPTDRHEVVRASHLVTPVPHVRKRPMGLVHENTAGQATRIAMPG